MQRKPLYEELTERFNSTIETDNLQKKKAVLSSLRDLYKPLDFKKIEEEQKQKEDLVREKNEERKKQLAEWQKQNAESYDFKRYNSRYITRVLEEEMDRKENEQQREELRKSLHQKMRSYNELIKDKFAPVVSKEKQEEIKRRRQSLEMSPKEKYKNRTLLSDKDEMRKIYKKRMQVYKSMPKKEVHTPNPIKHASSIDYLREFRLKRNPDADKETDPVPKSKSVFCVQIT